MKACITCSKPGSLTMCHDCVGRAESMLYPMVPWTKFERAEIPDHDVVKDEGFSECWKNSRYTVLFRELNHAMGPLVHLSIKRNDKNPLHDWRDLHRIKNEILGPNEEAVELYPAEVRLVDAANQYHLWSFVGQRAPFGYNERVVMEGNEMGAKQRAFEKKPEDILSEEQFQKKFKVFSENQIARKGYTNQIRSILEAASGPPCSFSTIPPLACEMSLPGTPEKWCSSCMARLLRKLGTEAAALT